MPKRGVSGGAEKAKYKRNIDFSGRLQGEGGAASPLDADFVSWPESTHGKDHAGLGDPNSLK